MPATFLPRRIVLLATGDPSLAVALAPGLVDRGHAVQMVVSEDCTQASPAGASVVRLDDQAEDLESAVVAMRIGLPAFDTVIFANAFRPPACPLGTTETRTWDVCLRRNSTVAFLVARHTIPVLRMAQSPRMVFLLPHTVRGMPEAGLAAFLSSKASLIGLARTLALELGPEGVLVNSVACPFDVDSGTAAASAPPTRAVGAVDISSAISFLISPDSSFITGKTLDVNGGSSML